MRIGNIKAKSCKPSLPSTKQQPVPLNKKIKKDFLLFFKIVYRNEQDPFLLKKYKSIENKLLNKGSQLSFEKLIIDFLKELLHEKHYKKVSLLLRMLDIAQRNSSHKNEIKIFKNITDQILDLAKFYSPKNPSMKRNKSPIRTPIEILVHLLAKLEKIRGDEDLSEVVQEIKNMILNHNLTISDVNVFLKKIIKEHSDSSTLICLVKNLRKSLIKGFVPTRFHDNIYGRAFESYLINALVENPPKRVQDVTSKFSKKIADYLNTLKPSQKAAFSKVVSHILRYDERFWFPKVPLFACLRDKKSNTFKLLIQFLEIPQKTGYECIAIPYLTVIISLSLRKAGFEPTWLEEATHFYKKVFAPKISRVRLDRRKVSVKEKEAGIKLNYQPSMVTGDWMKPTLRPSLTRLPNFGMPSSTSSYSALMKGLRYGIPWISGLSGSTNVNLFTFRSLGNELDIKAFLLCNIMFLVYDGGHSIHESLWVTHQLNERLNLELHLSESVSLSNFIAKYTTFADMYEGEIGDKIHAAFDLAFDGIIDYFNTHSRFAKNIPC